MGATPVQVFIDGATQIQDPIRLQKEYAGPIIPDITLEKELEQKEVKGDVIFTGVQKVLHPHLEKVSDQGKDSTFNVVISNGAVSCIGSCSNALSAATSIGAPLIDVKNGVLSAPFTCFGTTIGLVEMDLGGPTADGDFTKGFPRAIDGLSMDGKQLRAAYSHGVSHAISVTGATTIGGQFAHSGVSVGFRTGGRTAADNGSVWAEEVSAHYYLTPEIKGNEKTPSISLAVGALRTKLLDTVGGASRDAGSPSDRYSETYYLREVVAGRLPLVLTANSADTIAAIIRLKADVERAMGDGDKLHVVVLGGIEAHLVAGAIAAADIGVVVSPLLPSAWAWDMRRLRSGAPLTNGTTLDVLLDTGVRVAVSTDEMWSTRNLRWFAGWARRNRRGGIKMSEQEAVALVGQNVWDMLGLKRDAIEWQKEWTVWEGDVLEVGSRIRGVGSGGRVDIWT